MTTNYFDSIPIGAEIFAVGCEYGATPVLNGDIVKDHDGGCWKFLAIVPAARVSDCRVTARHAVSGKLVTTTPTAFNLKIVWEVE